MHWPPFDADHLMVTGEQMANLEKKMFSGGLPVASLMEKVGQAMAAWFLEHPKLLEHGVLVLVGPGHNGGDGLVVARELHLADIKVQTWCPLPITKTLTANHWSYVNWLGIEKLHKTPDVADKALWIEALFGLAQSRPLPKGIATLLNSRESCQPGRLVSLDLPAGLSSDSGRPFSGGAAMAFTTLTVGLVKKGLVQDQAYAHVGRLERVDIGLSETLLKELPLNQPRRICTTDLETVPWPYSNPAAMKYHRGRVMIIAGSANYRGAALLALKGAIASGVGSINAVVPSSVAESLWQVAPEVVLAWNLDSFADGDSSFSSYLENNDLSRMDAVLVGPGLGSGGDPWGATAEQLERFSGLLVLDADGLNRVAMSDEGWRWFRKREGPTWITPHISEFKRLFPHLQDLDPVEAAVQAAINSGVGLALKGAHSLIAEPSGAVWQVAETSPWVARSGLGDLLAGYVAGLGAFGLQNLKEFPGELLAVAVFLHAEAARRCRKGSSAGDVAESLKVLTTSVQAGECGI